MNDKPLVSVCMITYNHETFIKEAIDGVLMQDCNFEVELIVADDCSTDNTESIVRDCIKNSKKGNKIRYTKHMANKGMMSNFLWALSQIKGQYIALCDGDDYWTDSLKLKKQVDFLEANKDFTMCFHPCHFLEENNSFLRKQNLTNIVYDYTIKNLLIKWAIPTSSIIYRVNDTFDNFPSWIYETHNGDIALTLLQLEQGKFKLIKEHMSVYRLHGSGVSESHKNARMIHYRTFLYSKLNEYFNYKYENEIYEALFELIITYMPYLKHKEKDLSASNLLVKLKDKVLKKLKLD